MQMRAINRYVIAIGHRYKPPADPREESIRGWENRVLKRMDRSYRIVLKSTLFILNLS